MSYAISAVVVLLAYAASQYRNSYYRDYCESRLTKADGQYMVVMGKIYCHTGNNVYVR